MYVFVLHCLCAHVNFTRAKPMIAVSLPVDGAMDSRAEMIPTNDRITVSNGSATTLLRGDTKR